MFTFYQSKWRHEKKCDKQNFSKNIENKFKQIETKLKEIDTFLSKTNLLNINTLLEDEESELIKIQYKKNFYYLDNNMLYEIFNGKKGKLFAHYSNGKVVVVHKEKPSEIEV